MSNEPTPEKVTWLGPEGWTVWANEDGVHLCSYKGDTLEPCDLDRLIDLVKSARAQVTEGRIPAPKPPTAEQARERYAHQREEYTAKRAARAVFEAIAPTATETPF